MTLRNDVSHYICQYMRSILRSSRREVLCEKGVLENITKFTGKHLCQKTLEACNFIKKETLAQVFPVNFVKFLRTPFYRTPLVAASAFFQQRKAQLI